MKDTNQNIYPKDKYCLIENYLETVPLLTMPAGLCTWIIASLVQANILQLKGIKKLHFTAWLESIAAFFGLISFISTCATAYILYQRLYRTKQDLLPAPEPREQKVFYIEVVGSIILTAMQLVIAVDLWTNNVISNAHKKIGIPSIQTIFDSIGLAFIVGAFFASVIIQFTDFNEKNNKTEKQENSSHKEEPQKSYITKCIIFATPLLIKSIAHIANISGKMLNAVEEIKGPIIPLENGGQFPLCLMLRIVGVGVLFLFKINSIGTKLNEPITEGVIESNIML